MKNFFIGCLAIIIIAIVFFAIIAIIVPTPKTERKPTEKAAITTPELLIAPATPTQTATPIGAEFSLTLTAIAVQPTNTPRQIRNAQIPIYSGDGTFLGYVDNSEPTPTPRHCTIKGNVSWRNNDEKIYHCPNWRDYDRTEINWEDGDRMFCSEQEAIAAGFRRPQNVGNKPCIP